MEMSNRPRRYKSDLNFLIEKHLREGGIEIPNPQRDLHIRSGVLKVQTIETDHQHDGENAAESVKATSRS
jgi:small-conductance mechanosensitive channel